MNDAESDTAEDFEFAHQSFEVFQIDASPEVFFKHRYADCEIYTGKNSQIVVPYN